MATMQGQTFAITKWDYGDTGFTLGQTSYERSTLQVWQSRGVGTLSSFSTFNNERVPMSVT